MAKKRSKKQTVKKYASTRERDFVSSRFPTILIAIGLVLLGLWGLHRFLYNRSLSLSDALVASYKAQRSQVAYPVHISIGDKINIPIVEETVVDGVLQVSPDKANHLLASAFPGENGNDIIYGHNLNTIFGYLVDARVGDPVAVITSDGVLHRYKISQIHIVDPSQTTLLAPTTSEVLTLYTCTGLLDSLRLVARAEPVPAK